MRIVARGEELRAGLPGGQECTQGRSLDPGVNEFAGLQTVDLKFRQDLLLKELIDELFGGRKLQVSPNPLDHLGRRQAQPDDLISKLVEVEERIRRD